MPEPLPWAEDRADHKGRFDELVCTDVAMVHVETMSDGHVWIGIYGAGGRVTLGLHSKKRISVHVAHEHDGVAGS